MEGLQAGMAQVNADIKSITAGREEISNSVRLNQGSPLPHRFGQDRQRSIQRTFFDRQQAPQCLGYDKSVYRYSSS
jgi:hypothetical protein